MGVPQGVSRYAAKLAESKGRKHKMHLEMTKIDSAEKPHK